MQLDKSQKIKNMSIAALLSAIIIIFAFTPLGFLKLGVIEITFISVPVTIGAILLGPLYGLFFGSLFGLASFIQCFGMSAFGATLLAINPVFTFILCMLPRALMGYITGLAFKLIDKVDKKHISSYAVASFLGPALNTIFFVGLLPVLFGNSDYIQNELMPLFGTTSMMAFLVAFVGVNGLVEAIAGTTINFALSKGIRKISEKRR